MRETRRAAAWDCSTLMPHRHGSNRRGPQSCAKHRRQPHCYHHIEMRPELIGRVLGTGLRVAGRVAGERMSAGQTSASSDPRGAQGNVSGAERAARGRAAGRTSAGVARGVAGFLRPFKQVGGKLMLEVTGVFFFLPVLVFAPTAWRTRASFASGPDHRTFVASVIVVVVFFYLGATSFWRARKR
jgi:hypothetical protein